MTAPGRPGQIAAWRRGTLEVQTSSVVAGKAQGPEPPPDWAPRLRRLVEATRDPQEGPSWWTPMNAYFGSVETRTDPRSYYWDGMKRLRRRDAPLVFFQFTLAGYGHFELYGRSPQRVPPGTSFFAVVPSRHLLLAPGLSGLDLRLDRHLSPVPRAADREAGRGDRAAVTDITCLPIDRSGDPARARRIPEGLSGPIRRGIGVVRVHDRLREARPGTAPSRG